MRRKTHYRNITFFIVVLSLIFILSACGQAKKVSVEQNLDQDSSPSNIEAEKKIPEEEQEPELKYVYPLTGIKTNEPINHRVLGVMVNNHSKARPQTGLYQADVVYEALAEGNITRFVALYQSEMPNVIGPVRSARDYYINLSRGYEAIYISHGYSPEAKDMLLNKRVADFIDGIQYDGILFKRDSSRRAPHNSYISYENIKKGAKNFNLTQKVKPLLFLNEGEMEKISGEAAEEIMITYSNSYNVAYKYNGKEYVRFSAGEQTIDRESKEPVLVSNIFIVEVPHKIIDNVGRRDLKLTAGGDALLVQKGIVQKVEWKNIDGRILPYKDGKEVGLVPGKTWINIIPTSPGIESAVSYQPEESDQSVE